MASEPQDDSKDARVPRAPRTSGATAGYKDYLAQLSAQKKQAEEKQDSEERQQRRLKANLARKVLGASSFDRLYPRAARAEAQSSSSDGEVGAGVGAGGAGAGGNFPSPCCSSSGTVAERCDSPSQIPKLPPVGDACDAVGASGMAGGGGGSVASSNSHLYAARLAAGRPHPLSRSQSLNARGMGGLSSAHAATLSVQQPPPPQQQRLQAPGRRRRATLSNPTMRPVQEAGSEAGDGGAADDEGPDVMSGVATRRRDKPARAAAAGVSPARQSVAAWQAQYLSQSQSLGPGGGGVGGGGVPAGVSSKGFGGQGTLQPTPAGYAQWRARLRLPEGQRVFCVSGTGNHSHGIRAGLLARGWFENPDHNSPFFDYKWSSNPLDVAHEQLWPGQAVNHFRHAQCLTTKHGLCHTLREMVWWEAADAAAFYPRAYDISDEGNRREYMQDVRWTAAESLIKRALLDGSVCSSHVPYTPGKKAGSSSIAASQQQQQHAQRQATAAAAAATTAAAAVLAAGNGSRSGAEASISGHALGVAEAGEDSGGGQQPRLQQRIDSTPLVDLPSLRLACRVVAARLRHQRHLRVVRQAGDGGDGGGGGGGNGSGVEKSPVELELSPAQWQQLVKHRALFCSAPIVPPPDFDPDWMTNRRFITSAYQPRVAVVRKSGGERGGGAKSPRRKRGKSHGRSPRGKGGDGSTALGRGSLGTDGEAVAAAAAGGTGPSDADGEAVGGGGAGGGGGGTTGGDGGTASSLSEAEDNGSDADGVAAAAVTGGPVAVADAAQLLQEGRRRRHSAPVPREAGAAEAEAEVAGTGEGNGGDEAGAGSGSRGRGGSGEEGEGEGGAGSCNEREGDGGSWHPTDLPPICYDDTALQILDHGTWRDAAAAILGALGSSWVQTHISGTNNIWIVKPAGKSRGRGIRLFNEPDALLGYIRGEEAQGLESRWIAQKYVERPLIIAKRKFDIRQWVLVTNWNPLQVWFYSTCYLRFAADDYDPNCLDLFQHLTNNSVSKYYEGPNKEDEITTSGNMWSIPRFQTWLSEEYGRDDLWQSLLQPAMKHIAICSLKCAQDLITPRKGSCQLYGFDFLIDDQLRVWLLEVNSSPTLEASTPITAELCADVQDDILKVTVDLPDHLAAVKRRASSITAASAATAVATTITAAAAAAATSAPAVGGDAGAAEAGVGSIPLGANTGKWECIVDGGEEMKRPDYTGLNLELKGTAIPVPNSSSTRASHTQSSFVGRLHAATRQMHQQLPPPQRLPPQPQPQQLLPPQRLPPQPQPQLQQLHICAGKPDGASVTAAHRGAQLPYSPHRTSPPQQQRPRQLQPGSDGEGGGTYAEAAAAAVRVYGTGAAGTLPSPSRSRASPIRNPRTPRISSSNAPAAVAVVGVTSATTSAPPLLSSTWDAGAGASPWPVLTSSTAGVVAISGGGGIAGLLTSLPPPAVATPRLMVPQSDVTLAALAGAAAVAGGSGPGPSALGSAALEPLSPLAVRAPMFSRPGVR